jgi:hypothetical protein
MSRIPLEVIAFGAGGRVKTLPGAMFAVWAEAVRTGLVPLTRYIMP